MSGYLRLRIENCVATILEVNQYLGEGQIRPEIIRQFKRLQHFLKIVSDEAVDEECIDRIEEATNQLLEEIRNNMAERDMTYTHQGMFH
ncbi:MAG: hypothetical protein AAGU11_05685 [Syntrophobacteraceae bacterium]